MQKLEQITEQALDVIARNEEILLNLHIFMCAMRSRKQNFVLMKISLSMVYLRDVEMLHINHKKLLKFNLKIGK